MTYGNYPDLKKVKRVLVVKLRHHGDVLLTSAFFSQLKRAIPDAEVTAFIYADTLSVLEGHPAISHYLLYDKKWKRGSIFKKISREVFLLRSIRLGRYDLVINLTEGDRGAVAAWISGAFCRVGLDTKRKGLLGSRRCYTHLVKVPPHPRHIVERQLDALRCIGIFPGEEDRELYLQIPREAKEKVSAFLNKEGVDLRQSIVIHPVSRWRFKCLSILQMAQLIEELHRQGFPLILSSGPDLEEKAMVASILALVPHIPLFNTAGKLTMKEFAALIALCRAVVCVDSVPLHIASATKTPVVALFGPTSEQNWGPWMHPRARVISHPISCRPCYHDGCGGSKMSDCLFSISIKRIAAALNEVLADSLCEV